MSWHTARSALDAAFADRDPAADPRAAIKPALKAALEQGRTVLRRAFERAHHERRSERRGELRQAATARMMDALIGRLFIWAQALHPDAGPVALVATGGYGRGELAPRSDIDLLFLVADSPPSPQAKALIEFVLYSLWDQGLKVGQAVRTIEECITLADSDATIMTALLEARWLAGDAGLFAGLRAAYAEGPMARRADAFVTAKLAERDARHKRQGDAAHVLEPNVKEGKGGLRDLHALIWAARFVYGKAKLTELVQAGALSATEARRYRASHRFLSTVRCLLHDLTNRAEDRLSFEHQPELARRLGYVDRSGALGVERFMKHYFLHARAVGDLSRTVAAAVERHVHAPGPLGRLVGRLRSRMIDGFRSDGSFLTLAAPGQFDDRPLDRLRIFKAAHAAGLDIHPDAWRTLQQGLGPAMARLRGNAEANALFLDMLLDPGAEAMLGRMTDAGLLGRFIPDFGRIVGRMQYDMYHVYTVDEHTLRCIGILHRIEKGEAPELPLATHVAPRLASRRALYVAMFCHDIAKGRGGDHSILGAKVCARLAPRLGLTREETETAVWLVRWHLLMSDTATKRDLQDDRSIRAFAAEVQSPERLNLLTVLTTADINGVGPGRWTQWKAALLAQLYEATRERLTGATSGEGREHRIAAVQDRLRAALPDWSDAALTRYFGLGYPSYWLSLDHDSHVHLARVVRDAETERRPLTIVTRHDHGRGVSEVVVYCPDHPGLFARLSGALAAAGANILDAKIYTLRHGMALDLFTIQDSTGSPFSAPDRVARLSVLIEQAIGGRLNLRDAIAKRQTAPARARLFPVPARVLIDSGIAAGHSVIEINGRDRPGLLHELTHSLSSQGLTISTALIATYGAQAVDVFYVKDIFGQRIEDPAKIDSIRAALMQVLEAG